MIANRLGSQSGASSPPRGRQALLPNSCAAAPSLRRVPPRRCPSGSPGPRAPARTAAAGPFLLAPVERAGAAASGHWSGSPTGAAVRAAGWWAGRIRLCHGRIWGSTEERLRLVVGWVPFRRRRRWALGGEAVARPARGAFRPEVGRHFFGRRGLPVWGARRPVGDAL
jgi:hypothetical protein